MTPIDSLVTWWHAREPREQLMLALMLAAVGAFVAWYGIAAPLQRAGAAALAHHERAAADHAEIAAAVAAIQAHQQQYPPLADDEAFAKAILSSADAQRVPVSRQRHDANGSFIVGIDAVDSPALMRWLDALRSQHGIAPEALDVGKRNGMVRAEIAFKSTAP